MLIEICIRTSKEFLVIFKDLVKHKQPTLFHCSAGKDRTGFAAYLIYSICGIKRRIYNFRLFK